MPAMHELATITSKGQITLPKPIRRALGVDVGSKLAFDLREDGEIIVSRAEADHRDPAIDAFLTLLANDIQAGRHVQGLRGDLARAMLAQARSRRHGDEEIDGEVAL